MHVYKDGQSLGPFTEDQLLSMLGDGALSYDDLLWREDWNEWRPLSTVYAEPAFDRTVRKTPPPVFASNPSVAALTMTPSKKRTSGFEKFIFQITRGFVLLGAVGVIVFIGILLLVLFSTGTGTKVTYAELAPQVQTGASPSPDSNGTSPNDPSQLTIPDDLQPYFTGDNQNELQDWTKDLTQDQKRDFVNNLSEVVRDAKRNNIDPNNVIQAYRDLKIQKLQSSDVNKYQALALKASCVTGIFGALILLTLLCVVLVMLAIERNTRSE